MTTTPPSKAALCRQGDERRAWSKWAIKVLEADGHRSVDTHLIPLSLPGFPGIDIYFKDESSHPTGSLKHRLARSLILYGICNGLIGPRTPLVEASSGSTAVSEAYYARLLKLPFFAVLPRSTSRSKVEAIEQQGGQCHFVDEPSAIYQEAQNLATRESGHYLDQFTYAERATDWRGNNNIAESIFAQLTLERFPEPKWIVMSPGTGGTSATLGRYVLYRGYDTKLCVPDPEYSAFFEAWCSGNAMASCAKGSRIEGIGRPRLEASFMTGVVDTMLKVPDAASLAAMRVLSRHLGRRVGASSGTNFIGVLWAASQMRQAGEDGSLVSIICDGGDRYAETYYNDEWVAKQGFDLDPQVSLLEATIASGSFEPGLLLASR